MRTPATLFLLAVSVGLSAQVEVTKAVSLTGAPEQRVVTGLGHPATQDAAITVEASLLGVANWAVAVHSNGTVTLTPAAPLAEYRNGQLLRFTAPTSLSGPLDLKGVGLGSHPLLRPDGALPARGQIVEGRIIEVLFAGDHWVLLGVPEQGCPVGTIAISERSCIEATGVNGLFFYASAVRCESMGGRLCNWPEFYIACSQFGAQLNGLLDTWEWLDDSSNHANSAVQVGLGACTAQRWANPESVTLGRARCCFDTR